MIEIVFSESTAGSLKFVKSMKQWNCNSSEIASIGVKRKGQIQANTPCYWPETMEGCSADVGALTLALDIGDISDMSTCMSARKKLLFDMHNNISSESNSIWETNQHTLARLQEAKKSLEPVRVWKCACNPAEMCGLYFVCSLMGDSQTPLSVVCIPEQIEKDNCIISYHNTGEISPQDFCAFIKFEESISVLKRRVCSDVWRDLMNENAPLRAIINGNLIGVPIDFYDFVLRANIPDKEFKIAELIGKTLIQMPGIGDYWLFLRVQNMLQTGELIMVSAAAGDKPYAAIVKRNSK